MAFLPNETQKWTNIASLMLQNRKQFRQFLTDEEMRIRVQFFCVFCIFCVVSAFMTVVNVITHWRLLMFSTLFFSAANLINIVLTLSGKQGEQVSRYLFAVEILVLFTFFTISGEPEGFSAIWMALLPAAGLLLYRLKYGFFLASVQFLVLIFLFWTPIGKSLLVYNYTTSFMLRFPLLYVAFFVIGSFFEYIRFATHKELLDARARFEHLSRHDVLTGLYNRSGFNDGMANLLKTSRPKEYAMAILDIDNFKRVNDTFGHQNGDVVLTKTANTILEILDDSGRVCRWGGEEFAILFLTADTAQLICQRILQAVRHTQFDFDGTPWSVTASMGLVEFRADANTDLNRIFVAADKNLYDAKEQGKDRLIATSL